MSQRRNNIPLTNIRPVEIICGFHTMAEGSVLYRCGNTRVLCTASIEDSVPDWMKGKGKGWITAEYQMHPRSNPVRREKRDGRERPLGGRTREIQRLIGRSLRASIDLGALGERSVTVDCDVLEADGGTRTASISGGFIALALALDRLRRDGRLTKPVLVDQIAAISVGHVEGELALDLCYAEDSIARVDLNLVATAQLDVVEVQGTAEGRAVPRSTIDQMIDLGLTGITRLTELQNAALKSQGVDLQSLLIAPTS
ncbi:MAG TPA: ribonuclease PH [Polyangiaceae bacterium]|nr:ribonuclease PH [Polyangiaceae bacterium]